MLISQACSAFTAQIIQSVCVSVSYVWHTVDIVRVVPVHCIALSLT